MWWETARAGPETGRLAGELTTDVAVIGAGFTGLSTALHLAEMGASVVVVEAGAIGEGASGRNAGHISPSLRHGGPEKLARTRGREGAERLVRFQVGAADLVFERITRHAMDCGARRKGRLQLAHTPAAFDSLAGLADEYAAWGLDGILLDRDSARSASGSERYFGAWRIASAGVVNPLAYARGLARAAMEAGATVLTDSPIAGIRRTAAGWRAEGAAGAGTAARMV
ncbi:MAG: FAD-dependent oxidoreductase, partial [Proteobacteria bacterium]|nr:FAD-dependent oxidoreductase [Pseudomonadota bacterium]